MKVLVEINDELFTRMKQVAKGSLHNFILVSIENQIAIEESKSSEILDLSKIDINTRKQPSTALEKVPIVKPLEDVPRTEYVLDTLKKDRISFARNENTVRNPDKPLKNYFIWGQYNKIFPVKFSLRYLAKMQSEIPNNPILLTNFQNECSIAATKMKQHLLRNDKKYDRIWGENFSAGFPDLDPDKKSQSRFIHHFIGYANSQGDTIGSLGDYGFAIVIKDKIYFTPSGIQFAELNNPILDEDPMGEQLLSSEEREFLIGYLKNQLPRDWDGIMKIIKWISQGSNTPDSLNGKIKSLDVEGKWTDKMVNTMRTGFLGRMYDMDLVYREKKGNKSVYFATDAGKRVGEIA